jgi:hypothetical protein
VRNRTFSASIPGAALAAALLVLAAVPAAAQNGSEEFSGSILIGVRTVDVGGAERKFREDYDLDDGPRLFEFRLDLSPAGGLAGGAADRLFIDATNLGGDPYETLAFGVEKDQAYEFRYDRRTSSYFYEDVILPPELADIRGSTGGDFHHFDFVRVHDRASFDLDLTSAASLHFGLDRFTKEGEATTTLDLSRDEFELDQVIDESLNDYVGSFEYAWDKVTLVLEERVRDYENLVEIFLPGFSLGENPTGASLDFYFLDRPYDLQGNRHTARLLARPTPRFNVVLSAALDRADLDAEASERSQGIAFNGLPLATDVSGSGEIERDVDFFDLDVDYRLTDRLALIAGAYRHDLDQTGEMRFETINDSRWEIRTTGGEAGLQYLVSPTLTVSGGVSIESRDVDFAWSADDLTEERSEQTDREGFFADLAWKPSSAFQLTVAADNNTFDDPFTLASPTDRQRYRVNARYRWGNGLFFTGVYQLQDVENDNSGWAADSDRLALRLGWGGDGLDVSLGYAIVDVERQIDQVVNGTLLFPIDYTADVDLIDGRLRWAVNDRWTVGGSFRTYDNGGSFALSHDDYRAFVEVNCPAGYLARVGYRTLDYDEDRFDFDDYDADIAEFAVGYRW